MVALAGASLLAACGQSPFGEQAGNSAAPAKSPVETVKAWVEGVSDDRPRVYCAVGQAALLAQDCRLETVEDAESRVLILYRPDGGFRRLRVGPDGGLQAADGAVDARVARNGGVVGVLFGDERYAVPVSALRSAATP